MQIIITMAGAGKRFRDAGYNVPKYMIEAKGKTLFEWSMESLRDYNKHTSKYLFVVKAEDNACKFIESKCDSIGIKNIDIIELNHTTDGQATTCMLAMRHCNSNEAVMVYNIDTYVEAFAMKYEDVSGDGYIPCFFAEGSHWSFVKLNSDGKAIEVREKKRISDNCTLGAYYFSSAALYEELYEEYYTDNKHMKNNEKYIAPLYNLMIEKGMAVTISIIDSKKVHVLGTPEELEIFITERD